VGIFEKDRLDRGITNTLKISAAKKVQSVFRSELGVIYNIMATIYFVCLSESISQGKVIIGVDGKIALTKSGVWRDFHKN